MYHPTETANAIIPTSWFYQLYVHAPHQKLNTCSSRLKILFLLDTGASISVLNLPTYTILTKHLEIKSQNISTTQKSKTITVANQTEVPILNYITLTCNKEIKENSRHFIVLFAVADIKYHILGTPFFEKNIQSIDIQNLTMKFRQFHQTCPNNTKFTTITEKDYPLVSYIYMITSKEAIHFPPNNSTKQYTFQLIIIQSYTLKHQIKNNFFLHYHIHISHPNLTEPLLL